MKQSGIEKSKIAVEDIRKKINSQAIGVLIGSLALGPAGSLVGAAIAGILEQVLEGKAKEKSDWKLLRTQQFLFFFEEKLKDLKRDKKVLRVDLEQLVRPEYNYNNKSHLSEIFEALILASENEYQERKIQMYANLVANIHVSNDLDKSQIIQLIQISEKLSWQQICLISLAGSDTTSQLRKNNYRKCASSIDKDLEFLLLDLKFLCDNEILCSGSAFIADSADVNPSNLETRGIGLVLYNKMNLSEIPKEEMMKIIELLK